MDHEMYQNLFDDLWENGRYEEAIGIYELLGRVIYRVNEVGQYYESKGLHDRAMAEYEHLIEMYLRLWDDFLPLPGGPPELFKLARWYEKTDPLKAEKYLTIYLRAEKEDSGTGREIEHKKEAQEILQRIVLRREQKQTFPKISFDLGDFEKHN